MTTPLQALKHIYLQDKALGAIFLVSTNQCVWYHRNFGGKIYNAYQLTTYYY